MYSPQLAGWVTASDAGASPSVAATWATTHSTRRAMHSSADDRRPAEQQRRGVADAALELAGDALRLGHGPPGGRLADTSRRSPVR